MRHGKRHGWLLLTALAAVGYLGHAGAASSITWSDTGSAPSVSDGAPVDQAGYAKRFSEDTAQSTPVPCSQQTFAVAEGHRHQACWHRADWGWHEPYSGYVLPTGHSYAGLISGGRLIPSPWPDTVFEWADGQLYMRDSSGRPQLESSDGRYVRYRWPSPGRSLGPYRDGPYRIGLRFATEARVMAFHDGLRTISVVNLRTDQTWKLDVGGGQLITYALSPNGRYLAVNGPGSLRRIFDTGVCATNCSARLLNEWLPAPAHGNASLELPRFTGDDVLSYYLKDGQTYRERLVRAPNTGNYLALGDSFASGDGAGTYLDGTDLPGINTCHTSSRAYPYLLGNDPALQQVRSVACSGARTGHISHLVQHAGDPPAGITRDWLPGRKSQLAYVSAGKPDVMTVSIGGNDIGFSNRLKRCLEPDTCYASYEDRVELMREINRHFDTVRDLYKALRKRTAPDARLYVVGYPSILAEQRCGRHEVIPFSQAERQFANRLTEYLNLMLSQAAAAAGVGYVDTLTSFAGARLCEDGSAVNGITRGTDALAIPVLGKVLSSGSFHPSAHGHELLAKRISQTTDAFRLPMPSPDHMARPPAETGHALADAPKSGRQVYVTNYDNDLANDVVHRGGLWRVIYEGVRSGIALRPLTRIDAWIKSDPRWLGEARTDATGAIRATFTIPADMPEGYHTLHLYGIATDGQAVDVHKTVYVTGDQAPAGIPRAQEGENGTASDAEAGSRPTGTTDLPASAAARTNRLIGRLPGPFRLVRPAVQQIDWWLIIPAILLIIGLIMQRFRAMETRSGR